MCLSPNQASLFIGDLKEALYQVCLKTDRLLKKLPQISNTMIQTILITSDQKYLFATDRHGSILQICLSTFKTQKIIKKTPNSTPKIPNFCSVLIPKIYR
jgi:hypothetical protein